MKVIEYSIDIAAPPQAVWDVLTDVDAYTEWNPFLTLDRAPVAVGDRLSVSIRPGRRKMTFRPTVTAFEPGREISWLGRLLAPGIFDGAAYPGPRAPAQRPHPLSPTRSLPRRPRAVHEVRAWRHRRGLRRHERSARH